MIKLTANLGDGTTITIENLRVNSSEEEYLVKAIEAANQHKHYSAVDYLDFLHKQLNSHRLITKQRKALQLLEQYKARLASIPLNSVMERSKHVRQTNHIAACEGWEPTTFTHELDKLWVEGKITSDEQIELFNLMYL
ncbi:hypothetical protein [Pontibacter litorisediminis]|uniref:antitoxin VbhA family protein n=1 Tax=Pontibacter litorisediminis TaxID=1846260 RepID=UPI0023ECD8CD|nr:hypothetical protein [Pontibacter litorisediminis]